jgi:hypothetical protein
VAKCKDRFDLSQIIALEKILDEDDWTTVVESLSSIRMASLAALSNFILHLNLSGELILLSPTPCSDRNFH